ncbi:cytosolic Fe-S cluster assembly factor CFD1 [Rhizoctonia solani 123E]|uniref:Cytosolic Fe-S cluster assembly factor CFD1 n=1 Tax=Rhizoctonia solani 123E TaxID=1423351 RepID=A0A074S890_9AGAM|nr:cytosolic Fe-S cluster assembly factor CFD1 [Rhizoctonia solani 123E]
MTNDLTMSTADTPIARRLKNVKHIILVLSGKGGVGKSSVSTQLALSLYASAPTARVGILDVDLTGPSIPRMLGVDGHPVHQSTDGWIPVFADGPSTRMLCMSVGFLLKNRGDSVVWRGPKKNAMIRQFLSDVRWGDLDYLVVDTPPGTSDEHLSLLEHLAPVHERLSSVVVTTPQAVALADAIKGVSFTRAVNLPILGVIENMSGYACPCCGEITNVFSKGGGKSMAEREKVHFLGSLPIDTQLVELLDAAPPAPTQTEATPPNQAEPTATNGIEQVPATDVSPVTQLNTLSGTATNGHTTTTTQTFQVLERYQQTPTWACFKPMAEYIIQKLE